MHKEEKKVNQKTKKNKISMEREKSKLEGGKKMVALRGIEPRFDD
jgi:hypothetical protein